ncbi:MAG: hypothetical protein EZS28_010125 [Streblomastix strix]|uniref:Uncharacterized protein n=1 Tax=Streblomastix strix TaxID=222440 RepID=A0A5J4WGZ6_9EUKA|nr:MAG: hypothetical protein EZS28_010125 [Streblomastix strix]
MKPQVLNIQSGHRIDIWRTIIADYQKIESDARHVSSMLRESTDVNGVWKQLLQLNETCNTISELAEESERTLESALLCTNALHNLEVAIDRHSQKIADLIRGE